VDDKAIVIGAGVAGLATARVLSRRYATVTVLERDTLPYGPVPPGTTGPRPRGIGLRNWYARQVTYASQVDPSIYRVATGVQHLVDPPAAQFRPGLAARVLRQARKGRRAATVRR
jgi:choline dehydrogenase-like flavoprotein